MRLVISPTQSEIQTVLRAFLLDILPVGVEVIQGQDNRVPEPAGTDFVVMTAMGRPRLATNADAYVDALFTGSIASDTMTIATVAYGALVVGSTIFGVDVVTGTQVTAFGTGSGGVGTYTVSPAQTVGIEALAAGVANLLQETEIVFQLDVHGPASADNAQTISTTFRDDYAVEAFAASGYPVSPLYADDPRQLPFLNENQQIETRYVVEAHIQANQTVTLPQQFADAVTIGVIDVDATYPP